MCNKDKCPKVQKLEEKVVHLEAQNEALNTENEALKKELEKYKKPPKDSSNSSIPPSQDPYRKPYPKKDTSDKKSGGQEGHKGETRTLSDDPDENREICTDRERSVLNDKNSGHRRRRFHRQQLYPPATPAARNAGAES